MFFFVSIHISGGKRRKKSWQFIKKKKEILTGSNVYRERYVNPLNTEIRILILFTSWNKKKEKIFKLKRRKYLLDTRDHEILVENYMSLYKKVGPSYFCFLPRLAYKTCNQLTTMYLLCRFKKLFLFWTQNWFLKLIYIISVYFISFQNQLANSTIL